MTQKNTYQSEFSRSPRYIIERPYQDRFCKVQSYQDQSYYCNQSGTSRAYYVRNPQKNYLEDTTISASLPAELGGEMPGNRSRFAGVPNW